MGKSSSSSEKMTPGKKRFITRILPLICVVAGTAIAFFGIRELVRAKASVDWPVTEGKIVQSMVKRSVSSGSKGASKTTYHARIHYLYRVNEKSIQGHQVAFGDYGTNNPSHARQIVSRYPLGKIVTVHYMRDNPEESVLEPGIKNQSWFLPVFGLVFFALGVYLWLFLPKKLEEQKMAKKN